MKQKTLYDTLTKVSDRIPISYYNCDGIPGPGEYIEDQEVTDLIKRKIIEPYIALPVISNVINRKQTIAEIIQPIEYRTKEVQKKYEQIPFIKRFDPQKEIFGNQENLIAKELEEILNVKAFFEKGFIVSDKLSKIRDKIYGFDLQDQGRTDAWGMFKPFYYGLRNTLPFGIAAVYFAETKNQPYGLSGDFLFGLIGAMIGALTAIPPMFFASSTVTDQIEKPMKELKEKAQYLDETITRLYQTK